MRRGAAVIAALAVAGVVAIGAAASGGVQTTIQPYAVGIVGGYEAEPLLSVADTVPEASDPSKLFQMVGIPDGLGAHRGHGRTTTLYMNHELTQTALSRTTIGEPRNRGAIVSKLTLDKDGEILVGERAYDDVYMENAYVGPAATEANTTPGFARLCSGSIAGPPDGFDRWIYFAGEESSGAATFDGMGGLALAIVDNKAHALPKLGHFSWENALVQPNRHGSQVVIIGMEDGPADLGAASNNSQVYMYVGTKVRTSGSVLRRNGLDNGRLYVLAPVNPAQSSEDTVRTGWIQIQWVEIPNAENLSDVQLEAASDARNAFRFARPEDGAFNEENRNHYVFVTTGGAPTLPGGTPANTLGRVYSLNLNSNDVLGHATMKVEVNADNVVAAGGDTALSPDNIDTSKDYLMINEDGTTQSRPVMAAKNRDGSIWRFRIGEHSVIGSSATRIGELDPPGRDGVPVGPGIWETSGIIDTSKLFGKDTWLFDVQAHPPTTAPGESTVEDGQLLLLRRAGHDDDD
jgi:hypothetical protein